MAELFSLISLPQESTKSMLKLNVLEIHSRLSQSARTRTSDMFRDGTNMILFSSDVSARGLGD